MVPKMPVLEGGKPSPMLRPTGGRHNLIRKVKPLGFRWTFEKM